MHNDSCTVTVGLTVQSRSTELTTPVYTVLTTAEPRARIQPSTGLAHERAPPDLDFRGERVTGAAVPVVYQL